MMEKSTITIDPIYIRTVLEAVDESKRIDALFELKKEYLRIINSETSHNDDFKKVCPQCNGQGYYENPDMRLDKDIEECGLCKGTGKPIQKS